METIQIRDFDKNGDFETALFTGVFSGTTQTNFDGYFRAAVETANGGPVSGLADTLNYIVTLGEGVDNIVLSAGDDQIYWSAGNDTINGGEGVDEIIVRDDYADGSIWNLDTSTELRHFDADGALIEAVTISNIERVVFDDLTVSLVDIVETFDINNDGADDNGILSAKVSGANFAASSVDATLNWVLNGSFGDDVLTGGTGDDVLSGAAGMDSLDGGDGYDVAAFSDTRNQYVVQKTDTGWSVSTVVADGDVSQDVDTLINIEALRFTDGLFSLEATSELVDEFVFGVGRDQTQFVRGTTFGETLQATATNGSGSAVDVSIAGGIEADGAAAFDQFVVDVLDLQSTRILDFQGLGSDGSVRDVLVLNDTGLTKEEILDAVDVNQNPGSITLNFNGNELILEGLNSADLTDLNISLDIV